MKQFNLTKRDLLKPIISAPLLVGLLVVAFWGGDTLHGWVWNPLTANSQRLDLSTLNDIYGLMQTKFDGTLSSQQALDGAKAGLVAAAGDPYTVYLTKAEAQDLNNQLSGKLSGIGVEVGSKNNALTVIAPVAGSPAAKAGMRPGDIIAQVNGQDTSAMSIDTAVSKIRGKAGTEVKLVLIRTGTTAPISLTITRADLTVPSVTWSMKTKDIGYITITTFGTDTSSLIDQAATDLKNQGAKKIILNLRNNGGGFLTAGVDVASEFLPQGKLVVEQRRGSVSTDKTYATGDNKLLGMPTIVLINGGSASASEIVSGALRDNGVAKLLGEQSFGKGSVQDIESLPNGAELKVTISHWFTPGGVNINKQGLKPDIAVKLTPADYNASQDPQLTAAIAALNQ
jgi:carboxyl-terminal processing protease